MFSRFTPLIIIQPEAFYLVHCNSKTANLNLLLVVYKKRDLLSLTEFSIKGNLKAVSGMS